MAAGEGFKTWQTGDVLTANDVNGYLMQGVWVFDDAADRTAQVTSPAEGNFSYLRDTNKLYYYTGSAWAEADTSGILPSEFTAKGDLLAGTGNGTFDNLPVGTNGHVLTADSVETTGLKWVAPAAGGSLVLIAHQTFSAVSSHSVNDVFSSTYKNYKIIINSAMTSGRDSVNVRLRVSGSDNSSNNYNCQFAIAAGASWSMNRRSVTSSWVVGAGLAGQSGQTYDSGTILEVFSPFESKITSAFNGSPDEAYSSSLIQGYLNWFGTTVTTSYTGFTLIPASSTITGSVTVYGYKES